MINNMINNCKYCGSPLEKDFHILEFKCNNHHKVDVIYFSSIGAIALEGNKYKADIYEGLNPPIISIFKKHGCNYFHVKTFPIIKDLTPENFQDKIERLLLFI